MSKDIFRESLEELMEQEAASMKERMRESIDKTICHLSFNPTRFYHVTYSNFENAFQKSMYRQHLAFILLSWEAIDNMMQSRNLAFAFRYSAATSILRKSFELMIRGTFLDSMAYDVITQSSMKYCPAFREEIENRLDSDEKLRKWAKKSTIFVHDIAIDLENKSDGENPIPNFHDIVMNLEKRQLLSPIPSGITYGLYRNLCKSVHGEIHSTDIHQRFKVGAEGFTTNYVGAAFERFLGNFDRTIDTGLVLTFNLLKREMSEKQLSEASRRILEDEDIDHDLKNMPNFMKLCKDSILSNPQQ